MKEANLVKRLISVLRKAGLDPHRIENLVEKGTPDILTTRGMIETKIAKLSEKGLPLDPGISSEQRAWWTSFWVHGGKGVILIQADDTYWIIRSSADFECHSFIHLDNLSKVLDWL